LVSLNNLQANESQALNIAAKLHRLKIIRKDRQFNSLNDKKLTIKILYEKYSSIKTKI
tara:strand:+ start:739 stop:912 length:174 start_codon:yes stop_codon:yes gene_type:complete